MTLPKFNKRYELENMPISEKTKEGIAKGNLSDALQTLLRAMGMLEFNLEDAVTDIKKSLDHIDARLTTIEIRLQNIEIDIKQLQAKDQTLEDKIKELETRLDDYYLRLKNHKHIEYEKVS